MICINIFEQKTHSTCRSKNWLVSFAFFFDIGWYKSNKANHFFFFLLKISMWETEDLFVYTSKNNYQWNEFFKLQTQKKSKGYSICLLCLSSSFFLHFLLFLLLVLFVWKKPFCCSLILSIQIWNVTFACWEYLELKEQRLYVYSTDDIVRFFFAFIHSLFFLVFYFSLFFMSVALTNCLNS